MEVIAELLRSNGETAQTLQPAGGEEEALSAGVLSPSDSPPCVPPPLRDCGVNTDRDWEEQIRTMLESGARLGQDFGRVQQQLQQDELDFNKRSGDVKKRRDQAVRQHQALLEKVESVRVKLQLNNSKATRKNFLSKIQEVTSQRNKAQEEKDRLCAELSEAEARLSSLQQEQEEERRSWEDDLADLREQTERAQNQAREAESKAEGDMRRALERQRETGEEMVQAWIHQVGVYLSGLRAELPHRHRQEKPQWDRREATVRRNQAELQDQIGDLLQQLDRHQLDTLPPIKLPALPQVPMAELYFHRIMQMTSRPPAPPTVMGPPPAMAPPPAILNPRPGLLPHPHPRHPHFPLTHPPYPRQHFHPPVMVMGPPRVPVTSLPVHAPPMQAPPPQQHATPHPQQAPPPQQQATPHPQQAPPPQQQNSPTMHQVPPTMQQAPPPLQQTPPPMQQAPPHQLPPPQQKATPTMHQAPHTIQQAPPPLQQTPPPPQQTPPPMQQAPPHKVPPPQQKATPTSAVNPTRAMPTPPPPSPVPPAASLATAPPAGATAPPAGARAPPAAATAPPAAATAPPAGATAPPEGATAPPAGAARQLGMVLDKLGVHFPRCSRTQLTWFLQQVKIERGTLAGLSMEEVVESIRQKAAASSASSAPPRAPEAATPAQAAPAPAPASRKPCLMCQKPVGVSERFELSCSHTVHTDCIQVWLQSSQSNNCPFCPNK